MDRDFISLFKVYEVPINYDSEVVNFLFFILNKEEFGWTWKIECLQPSNHDKYRVYVIGLILESMES